MKVLVAAALLAAGCGDDLRPADAVLLGDLEPGPQPSYPSSMTSAGPRAFLVGFVGAGDHARLFVTDATPDGTVDLAGFDDYPRELATLHGRVLFTAGQGEVWGLWRSDGTVDGTVLVRQLATTNGDGYPRGRGLVVGDRYYLAVDGTHGSAAALWASDGTDEGTIVLAPVVAQPIGGLGDVLLFVDGGAAELWRSEGTAAATTTVAALPGALAPGAATNGSRLYFVVDGDTAPAIWRSDGTAGGTREVVAITGDRTVTAVAATATRLFYATRTVSGTGELWISDGTTAGTTKLAERGADSLVARGEVVYAFGLDGVSRVERNGVTRLGDATGAHSPLPLYDRIVLAAFDPDHGDELWVTDGTDSGTRVALDLVHGAESSAASQFITVGGAIVFTAAVPPYGDEPWAIAIDDLVGNR